MPFERRSDVQVLEYDRSEMLLHRTTANRSFLCDFGPQKQQKSAAKTRAKAEPSFFPSPLSHLCQTGSAAAQQIPWAAVVVAALLSQSASPSRPCCLAVQQLTHCARKRIVGQRFLLPRKLLQLRKQLSSSWGQTGSLALGDNRRRRSGFETVCTLAEARRAAHRCATYQEGAKPPHHTRERQDRCRRKRRNAAPARTN